MRATCALVAATILSLAGCQQSTQSGAGQSWSEFAPEGAGFSVLMPGTPTSESTSDASAVGVIDSAWFDLEPEGSKLSYSLRYDDYPPGVMGLLGNVSQALFIRQKRLEHDVEGTTVDEEPVFLDEHAGKQLKLELPDGKVGIYRVFLIDARMYQLSVKAAPEDISAAEVSQFLDSFKLL